MRTAGVAFLSGVTEGLQAVRHLARWRKPRTAMSAGGLAPAEIASDRSTIHERDAKRLLGAAGMQVARETLVSSRDEAQVALASLGGPVVLKVVSDDIAHKSDYGLVELGIRTPATLAAAWVAFDERVATVPGKPKIDGILVQEMVPGGLEVFAGVNRDPEFGLVMAFGLGGTLVEVLRDIVLRPLPLRSGDVEAMIAETRFAATLLSGVRGESAGDVPALTRNLYALADFAWTNRDAIDEIDVNPIKVLPLGQGCRVVDALIVPRRS